jgi:hypothetical protein
MVSTTTYGDFPGVRVETAGGAITGVAVGREQKLVIIGVGDAGSGEASPNTAVQIPSRSQADTQFGDGTELSEAMKDALSNGANIDYLYGVMLDVTEDEAETFTSASSGTLTEAPIIEDLNTIDVQDTGDATAATVEFRYESPPSAPSDADTVFLNPITGEWTADSSSDYDFTHDYPDWTTAFDEAQLQIETEETGVIAPLTESESLATDLSGRVNTLRGEYKMATGLQPAEPNASDSDDNDARYDTGSYTDSIDNDAMFLHAPARKVDSNYLITGAVGGLMAGNSLNNSIYNENITVDNIDQRLSDSEAGDLRDAEVIPVKQPPSGGAITVADNRSTSTETDWQRDYWRRRIVDQVILIAKAVGDSVIGRINDERTRNTVESQISVELRGLVSDRLLEPNTDEETNWFVDVYEIDSDTVGIDIGITPLGIVKRVDTTITINA